MASPVSNFASDSLYDTDPRDTPGLSLLGHDLRAALSEVMGGLRLIEASRLPAEPRTQIARSRAACEALALLLEQAMTLLVGEGSEEFASPPTLRTTRFIDTIRLRWEGRAQEVGISFTLVAEPDLPALLSLDPAQIERILSNLLGNAIKYAVGGSVHCAIGLAANDVLQIKVTDDGPGFSEAALSRAFQTNYHPETAGKPGTGMGLRIVAGIVQSAGGTVRMGNLHPSGAEICVLLPFGLNEHPIDTTAEPLPNLGHLRMLVADDNATSRRLMTMMLGQMGAEVVAVGDGVSAIGRIERESFDVLLLDIEMPGFSGVDVIHYLRAMPGPLARLPILAITAYWLRSNHEAIKAAGANAVLSKPGLTAAVLGAAILAAVEPEAFASAEADTALSSQGTEATQLDHLLRIAGPQVAEELLKRLLADLQSVERGLLGSARRPNWDGIRAHTHVLIALAGTSGATRLRTLSENLNLLSHQDTPDRGTFLTLLPQTLEALDRLIHFVGHQLPPDGPSL